MGPAMSDYNMRLILSSVIQLSGGYFAQLMLVFTGKEKWKKLSTANYDGNCHIQHCVKILFFNESKRVFDQRF